VAKPQNSIVDTVASASAVMAVQRHFGFVRWTSGALSPDQASPEQCSRSQEFRKGSPRLRRGCILCKYVSLYHFIMMPNRFGIF
jgi:hypothetical protein